MESSGVNLEKSTAHYCTTTAQSEVQKPQNIGVFQFPNIVGYQSVALPANGQYSLLTPTFKDVGGASTIDLTDIAVVKPGQSSFTSKKKVLIQKMNLSTGAMTDIYSFTTSGNKWVNQSNVDVAVGDVTFAAGEAMCVKNGDSAGSDLAFQFSGTVAMTPVSLDVASGNYTLIGNFTPVSVDLTRIVPLGAGGSALGQSKKKILVQKIVPATGAMGEIYTYTTSGNKWVDQSNADVSVGTVVFAPGEAMCVKNGDSKTISISFPCPITE